jgi:hypothetical protein
MKYCKFDPWSIIWVMGTLYFSLLSKFRTSKEVYFVKFSKSNLVAKAIGSNAVGVIVRTPQNRNVGILSSDLIIKLCKFSFQ